MRLIGHCGGSDDSVSHNDLSNASKLVLFANVEDESEPPFKKSSNLLIAPEEPAKSLACITWCVASQPGPSTCLATNFQAVVFPEPVGPSIETNDLLGITIFIFSRSFLSF